ncbi:hypothetical protein CEXT_255581 [Caerostris extrusa]|uniref:Uncharacterized protein n=1 Tax=Caerostris extrusa TaxID=172846 RepID=A0AAV4QF47_CAEEX|nr:hypothetical protein CEXT_255581 [Caerostris extrusa]
MPVLILRCKHCNAHHQHFKPWLRIPLFHAITGMHIISSIETISYIDYISDSKATSIMDNISSIETISYIDTLSGSKSNHCNAQHQLY